MVDFVLKVLKLFARLRRTPFYQKYGLFVICLAIMFMIYFIIKDVFYSFTELVEPPHMGIKGCFLLLLLMYLGIELDFKFITLYPDKYITLFPKWVLAIFLFFCFSRFYQFYGTKVYDRIMTKQNIATGVVCKKRVDMGRGYRHNWIIVRYEQNDNIYKFKIPEKLDTYQKIDVGDSILILTSREYPQVMEVLKWNPTREEIERYKTPRKFKSFDSRTGKIIEEEVPDEVEGKEVIPSISVELDGVEQELQLEEHEYDEGVESADIVEIRNEVEDESIELEEFEYEFQPEKKKQVEENRVIDVRLNVIEKHE